MRYKLLCMVGAGILGLATIGAAQSTWPAGQATGTRTAWTGLVYSSNAPDPGTAARALFDGKNYLRNDMPANAETFLRRAITLDANLAEAHFWLAATLRKLRKPGAQEALATALRLDPGLGEHVGELAKFGPPVTAKQSRPLTGKAKCDDLYASCIVSANHCSAASGCQYDAGRPASCTGERNQCYARN